MRAALLVAVAVISLGSRAARAEPTAEAEAWRAGLVDRIVADLAAGKPLVVQVHVPLCDNDVIPCGNARLGDGDTPASNLYWGTTEGTAGWFGRRGSGWKQVLATDGGAVGLPDVLDLRVWRREIVTPRAWRARGVAARYPLYVVAFAWRGEQIGRAFDRYAEDLYGVGSTTIVLPDGTRLAAGGDAHVVAYVGHNHLMDLDGYDWRGLAARADPRPRGALAIACHTAVYVQDVVPGPSRVPLLFTRDFLLASSAALEGAVLALAAGGDYAAIRRGGAQGYATGGGKTLAHVFGAFSNPADRRWRTPGYSEAINAHALHQTDAN
ncbi:MAG TPA: hypothetical protein VHE35_34835 [Kofleriaceae bacterium]|nr:hypothetical protein [Kofleriaceae bacterium]